MKRILPLFLVSAIFAVQPAFSQAGTFDATFGTNGMVVTNFGGANSLNDLTLQSDGKIVAAGDRNFGGLVNKFLVARYLPDGSVDTSFGNSGAVETLYGAKSSAQAVTVQPDGKIVTVGYTSDQDNNFGNFDLMVVRYTSDGSLVTLPMLGGDMANAVAIQPDGKIVVGGTKSGNFILMRLMPDGTLDTSFKEVGYVVDDLYGYDEIFTIKLLDNDQILVAGRAGNNIFTLSKYNPSGTVDTTFGNNGVVKATNIVGIGILHNMATTANGDIIVAGAAMATTKYNGVLAKFTANGSPVAGFGTNGVLLYDLGASLSSFALDLVIKNDNMYVSYSSGPQTNYNVIVAAYDLNGVPDTAFGTNGATAFHFGVTTGTDYPHSMIMQPDGKLIVGGDGNSGGFSMARLNTEESLGVNQPIFAENGFAIYPNPVNSASVLAVNLQNNDVLTIKLYDVRGMLVKTVAENQNFTPGQSQLPLSLNGLGQGIYFLTVANQQGKTNTIKIIN
jgi:uncharacterized delta-60 repeat protein